MDHEGPVGEGWCGARARGERDGVVLGPEVRGMVWC